ncbi:MAG: phosphatidylserine decarboxylase [Pseudomonadales bacterium]|nr:phosphatidylserine decarboxylase [Pseudomonadales bacterium]
MQNDTRNQLFVLLQYLLPQHLISRWVGALAASSQPLIKNFLARRFIQRYGVDLSEAKHQNIEDFATFNDFFTRALREDARSWPLDKTIMGCPADGCISQLGQVEAGRIFQAKGQYFDLLELLGGDENAAKQFAGGNFATIYLSPRDYHRVHMPCRGQLERMIHVPGDLFSVNAATAQHVPRLFARNERVICLFNTSHGPVAMILVGAMIVASIATPWAGLVAPLQRKIRITHYGQHLAPPLLERGDEMGRFLLGSTVILLTGANQSTWNNELSAGTPVQMGMPLGAWTHATTPSTS